jgi:hypothetical protein
LRDQCFSLIESCRTANFNATLVAIVYLHIRRKHRVPASHEYELGVSPPVAKMRVLRPSAPNCQALIELEAIMD